MATMKSLVLSSFEAPPSIVSKPVPTATPGSAVIKILYSMVASYASEVYVTRDRPYPMPLPLTIGASAIGRVSETGPDGTTFKEGDLVLYDCFIRARDDPEGKMILGGIHMNERPGVAPTGSGKLMEGVWRNGTYAEFAVVPLENIHLLNENVLTKSFNYPISSVAALNRILIPAGALFDMSLSPGQTILIHPATGNFGSSAVHLALSMGLNVIAGGRNPDNLSNTVESMSRIFDSTVLKRLSTAVIKGTNVQEDHESILLAVGGQKLDACLDLSPTAAASSAHFESVLLALKRKGILCLFGGIVTPIQLSYGLIMTKSLRVIGKWMYERSDVKKLIAMVESGVLSLSGEQVKVFELEHWNQAFEEAKTWVGGGKSVVLKGE